MWNSQNAHILGQGNASKFHIRETLQTKPLVTMQNELKIKIKMKINKEGG